MSDYRSLLPPLAEKAPVASSEAEERGLSHKETRGIHITQKELFAKAERITTATKNSTPPELQNISLLTKGDAAR
jgi:hypothetical protein